MTAASLALLASGCGGTSAVPDAGDAGPPCDSVTCTGHGTCVATDGEPHCECDEGYTNHGALDCGQLIPVQSRCSVDGWCIESPFIRPLDLNDAWASGPDDVWVVGVNGIVVRRVAGNWTRVDVGTLETLVQITGTGPDDVWIRTIRERVLHWDGTSWLNTEVMCGCPELGWMNILDSIASIAPGQLVVSGEAGDMYDWTCRWEDGRWKLGLPHRDGRECGTIARCAIWASSPTDIWCSESRRWDGDQIVSVPGAGALQFNDRDIWGSSSDDIWVLGESGWMGHSDGRGISGEQIPGADALDLRRIHGAGSSALWAVGPGGILRRSGADWVIEPVPDPALQPISVAVGADDDAVVGGARGRLFAYDAGSWTDLSIPPPVADPRHVWGASTTEVWLGGRGMARWDGSSWTPVDLGPDVSDPSVRDLLGFADDDVWAILYQSPSQTRLAHYDGVSWTSQSSLDLGIDLLANLHGRAADDLWLSGVGSTGFVVAHWSGVSWTRINLPPDASAPLSMWSASATEVWVAWAEQHPSGEFFISWLARWDGSTWQIDELDHALVRDVFGFAADDVWACGDNGWLAHWDGTAWTTVASNTNADLMSLWGTSPTALWATGGRTDGADSSRNGVILRWDGNTWSPEAIPHRDNVTSVFGVGNVMWGTGDFLMRKQAM